MKLPIQPDSTLTPETFLTLSGFRGVLKRMPVFFPARLKAIFKMH